MCVFCKIINNEIPTRKIYEDNEFLAILDINPATIGHVLLFPKKHAENIFDLDEVSAKNIFSLTKKLALRLKSALALEAINILNNSGTLAGQTIMHFHLHLIPRYANDSVKISLPLEKVSLDALEKLLKD